MVPEKKCNGLRMHKRQVQDLPAAFIGEAIAKGSHVVTDCSPFRSANDANVLDRQDGKE